MDNFVDRLFSDVIYSNLNEDKEKRKNQLIVLFREIVNKLKEITPNRIDLHKKIDDEVELDYLISVIEKDVVNISDFIKFSVFVISTVKSYCAPNDDKMIKDFEKILHSKIDNLDPYADLNGKDVNKLITEFFLKSNKTIDRILVVKRLFDKGMKPLGQ